MIAGRWTCYMCAGAYEQAEENLEEYSIVSKFGWDRNIFYGDDCSETELVRSEDWRLSKSLGDGECTVTALRPPSVHEHRGQKGQSQSCAKSEKQSHFKADSATIELYRDLTCSPPLRTCGRLPTTGEDSEGDVSV